MGILETITQYLCQYVEDGERNKRTMIRGLPEKYPAYTMVGEAEIGVLIPFDGKCRIDEEFEGCRLRDIRYKELGDCLVLTTTFRDKDMIEIFAPICERFVITDDSGLERNAIIADPFDWVEKIIKLLGNARRWKLPTSVIAELYSVHIAHKRGLQPRWEGPDGSIVDIRGNTVDIEVKSTISQDRTEITISRELQLKKASNELHLYYLSLQESVSGLSIDDLVHILVCEDGFSKDELEEKLLHIGYREGMLVRTKRFLVTKLWDFNVDDDFPKIVPESFKDERMPEHITKIQYTINVSGLDYKNILE